MPVVEAEGVGFEPTVPGTRDGGFQDRYHKPLGHPSTASGLYPAAATKSSSANILQTSVPVLTGYQTEGLLKVPRESLREVGNWHLRKTLVLIWWMQEVETCARC